MENLLNFVINDTIILLKIYIDLLRKCLNAFRRNDCISNFATVTENVATITTMLVRFLFDTSVVD